MKNKDKAIQTAQVSERGSYSLAKWEKRTHIYVLYEEDKDGYIQWEKDSIYVLCGSNKDECISSIARNKDGSKAVWNVDQVVWEKLF